MQNFILAEQLLRYCFEILEIRGKYKILKSRQKNPTSLIFAMGYRFLKFNTLKSDITKLFFEKYGKQEKWIGSKNEILDSGNQKLNDFIFANKLYAQMKKGL